MLSATMTFFTRMPSLGVCFVINRWPTIFSTSGMTCERSLVMCTPPLNPLSKCPFPRPPARIWALMTYSFTLKSFSTSASCLPSRMRKFCIATPLSSSSFLL
uniref:Putative secreted protein n=1 Tax=Anopheles darlingi TaxID=43151 RepID=A0A2M4DGY5_ANODA